MADAPDLGSGAERRAGSSPVPGTYIFQPAPLTVSSEPVLRFGASSIRSYHLRRCSRCHERMIFSTLVPACRRRSHARWTQFFPGLRRSSLRFRRTLRLIRAPEDMPEEKFRGDVKSSVLDRHCQLANRFRILGANEVQQRSMYCGRQRD